MPRRKEQKGLGPVIPFVESEVSQGTGRNPFLRSQDEAQRKYGYGAIRLRREGNYALVEVEAGPQNFVTVIREHYDGNFCHVVEPVGIAETIERGATAVRFRLNQQESGEGAQGPTK